MTKNKDTKRHIRARMKKTGESYTSARAQVIRANPPKSDWASIAGKSDASVKASTGKDWAAWVKWLDAKKATSLTHAQIAKLVGQSFPDVGGWWAQSVTVAYERIRGLREVGQSRGTKEFAASKSKTFPVGVSRLYAAFSQKRRRAAWLGAEMTITTSTKDKSVRARMVDGTKVNFYFTNKAPEKSSVSIEHGGHATKKKAEAAKAFWRERLQAVALTLK